MKSTLLLFGVLLLPMPVLADGPASDALPLLKISYRAFRIPFSIDSEKRGRIASIRLYVTRDGGKTWSLGTQAEPSKSCFVFRCPEDGIYGFASQTILKDGSTVPDLKELKQVMKVWVVTKDQSKGQVVRQDDAAVGAATPARGG